MDKSDYKSNYMLSVFIFIQKTLTIDLFGSQNRGTSQSS